MKNILLSIIFLIASFSFAEIKPGEHRSLRQALDNAMKPAPYSEPRSQQVAPLEFVENVQHLMILMSARECKAPRDSAPATIQPRP